VSEGRRLQVKQHVWNWSKSQPFKRYAAEKFSSPASANTKLVPNGTSVCKHQQCLPGGKTTQVHVDYKNFKNDS
jgi:hypothetical protein